MIVMFTMEANGESQVPYGRNEFVYHFNSQSISVPFLSVSLSLSLNAFNDTRELSFLKHDQCYNIIFEVSLSCPLRLFIFTFI